MHRERRRIKSCEEHVGEKLVKFNRNPFPNLKIVDSNGGRVPLLEGEDPWKGLRISIPWHVSKVRHPHLDKGGVIIERCVLIKALAEQRGDEISSVYAGLIHPIKVVVPLSSFIIVS